MLHIKSSQKNYDVHFIDNFSQLIEEITRYKNAIIIIDQHVAKHHPRILTALKKVFPTKKVLATEKNKTLAGTEKILTFLQKNKANKNTTLIGIGGGILQDISSFAAHIFYRGIPFVFVPTTLLAMSDSCIGAKCSLNFHHFKNQLGTFHPPIAVFICDKFLETLSDQDIYSGYGEIVKLALIGGTTFWEEVVKTIEKEGFKNTKTKNYIRRALEVKKIFIEEDEFETDMRRILNFGHTFGHALETITDHTMPHGIAVTRGIDLVNFIAYKMGKLSQKSYQMIHVFLFKNFHCGLVICTTAKELIEHAKKDKKSISADLINFVLLASPGKLFIEKIKLDKALENIIDEYLQQNPEFYTLRT